MKEIINLEEVDDFKEYNPVLIISEDLNYDNRFCILKTNVGNVAFSYYDLGIKPNVVIQNGILFLSFGKSYYVINLNESKLLYQANDLFSIIFEIIKCEFSPYIVFIGELSLRCFSQEGQLIWENSYKNKIMDWLAVDGGILIVFENDVKWIVSYKDGNGTLVAEYLYD